MNASTYLDDLFFTPRPKVTNLTFLATNLTEPALSATWTLIPTFFVVTLIFGFVTNGTLLFVFMADRSLRTPFNIYLMNLLMADLLCLLIQYPMNIMNYLYSFKWFLGDRACTLYLYSTYILQAAFLNAHLLIAINRIWAVVHPVSFRSHHTHRAAIFFCLCMWLYVHLTVGSGWAMDALYYRLPVKVTKMCFLNTKAQRGWYVFIQLCIFDPPTIVMLSTFPIIFFTKWKRDRFKQRKNKITPSRFFNVSQQSSETKPGGGGDQSPTAKTKTTDIELSETAAAQGNVSKRFPKRMKQKSHGTLVLALLTTSVTICWTPGFVYFTLKLFMTLDVSTVFQSAIIMSSCQTMLDPILFMLALPNLRASLRALLG